MRFNFYRRFGRTELCLTRRPENPVLWGCDDQGHGDKVLFFGRTELHVSRSARNH